MGIFIKILKSQFKRSKVRVKKYRYWIKREKGYQISLVEKISMVSPKK